jgi:hypothetical protein
LFSSGKEIFDVLIIDQNDAKLNLALNGLNRLSNVNPELYGVSSRNVHSRSVQYFESIDSHGDEYCQFENFFNLVTNSKFYRLWRLFQRVKSVLNIHKYT